MEFTSRKKSEIRYQVLVFLFSRLLPEPRGSPPSFGQVFRGGSPPLKFPLLPSPVGPPARVGSDGRLERCAALEPVFKRWSGSEFPTGTLSARGVTGPRLAWRGWGEGEPAWAEITIRDLKTLPNWNPLEAVATMRLDTPSPLSACPC